MRRLLFANVGLLGALAIGASAGTLEVRVTDLRSTAGNVMVAVVDSEAGWKDRAPAVAQLILPVREGEIAFTLDALKQGQYAIRVFHDQNGNGELDSNLLGMPREPWGFSNDATGAFGPPRWSDARFSLEGDGARQTIRLNH